MAYPRKPCVECGYMVRKVSKPSEHAPTCSERAPSPALARAVEAWREVPEADRLMSIKRILRLLHSDECRCYECSSYRRAADLLRAAGGGA